MGYTTVARGVLLDINTLLFVNTGTTSSKWRRLIHQNNCPGCFRTTGFAYFGSAHFLVPTTLNIPLDIVSTSEL